MELSHEDCLRILADPSTKTLLETLGYEYSPSGQAEYRKSRPNIVPSLVQAIVRELEQSTIFPLCYRSRPPTAGVYMEKRGPAFVLVEIDKPSVRDEFAFGTCESAARAYVRKILDAYWLEPDTRSVTDMLRKWLPRKSG